MVLALKPGLMGVDMKESTRRDLKKAKVSSPGLTAPPTKANSVRTTSVGSGTTSGRARTSIKVSGERTKCTAWVSMSGPMEENTLALSMKISRRVMAGLIGLMGELTQDAGSKTSSMGEALSPTRKVSIRRVSGVTDKCSGLRMKKARRS